MLKRWATLPLVLCLLLTGVLPASASGMTRAERYDATISELRRYFTGEATMTLDELSIAFDGLGSYQHSVSFSLYSRVLRDAEAEIFTDAHLWIHQLRRNVAFCAYVADEKNGLAPVDAVESYLLARQAQSEGRTDEAIACYAECITLLDSNARLNALEMQLLEDKYQQALTLMAEGTQESLQAAIALWEELAALHYRDSAQRLEAAQNPTQATLPNGHTLQLALSQYRFTGPGEVTVSIIICNDSDTDAPGPIALYDPSGRRIADFGTPTLAAGEMIIWTGTWSVTQEQLDAGRIVFAAACVLPDESGAMTTKFTPFYGAIGYADGVLPENVYVDAFGEAIGGTVPPAPAPTASPTREPTARPTAKPTATPSRKPTAIPTAKPTATPTLKPTATPTLKPTATPTLKPTATPTLKPTATPTLKPTATPTPPGTWGRVTGTHPALRKGPSTSDGMYFRLNAGTTVQILSSVDGWYYVNYNGLYGYVMSQYVQILN